MKLSTRSRYGTRMMLDLAAHYDEGPVQIGDISRRENISVKYLEQLIIPLKKARLIESARGPKGGHMLTKSPEEITIGEIVRVMEGGIDLTHCIENPDVCEKTNSCLTRTVWEDATRAIYERLDASTLANIIEKGSNR
ncbi:MAG: Rrf2 family transcriptional regulator [Deltaproteobacteria bacterium]|nr:Rrf2 family transcriptional regulator [Deltaproteobacteria bacterium]